jgi:hypothetical protein
VVVISPSLAERLTSVDRLYHALLRPCLARPSRQLME